MIQFLIVLMFLVGSINIVYAGGVTDDNNGNNGYILVSTGENNGTNSVGHWTDASFLKGDKGDTGVTGAQGIQGLQGVKGDTGSQGLQGLKGDKGATGSKGIQGLRGNTGATGSQGIAGINGVDGRDGVDGAVGITGENGKDGINGVNGETGDKGDVGKQGVKGEQGVKGNTGSQGKDVDPAKVKEQDNRIDELNNKVNELEKPQGIIGLEIRVHDSRKWTVTTFVDYAPERSNIDRYGVRFTYKVGKSYEEARLDELEARLKKLDNIASEGEFYTNGSVVGYRTRF